MARGVPSSHTPPVTPSEAPGGVGSLMNGQDGPGAAFVTRPRPLTSLEHERPAELPDQGSDAPCLAWPGLVFRKISPLCFSR